MKELATGCLGAAFLVIVALPAQLLGQEPPSYLPNSLHATFESFTEKPSRKAFALSPRGAWGSAYGHESLQKAREVALSNCGDFSDSCVIIAENDEIVTAENPFPESTERPSVVTFVEAFSPRTTVLLAVVALALLVIGTVLSEKYPLYLFDTWLSDIWKLRMNYTILPFGFLYFLLMLPTFSRFAERDFSNPLTWVVFAAPIFPYVVSILYLRQKNKLSDRFEVK